MKKHQVHNLIILDESGSMQSIKKSIIHGFNEIVQTIKGIEKEYPEQEHYISLVSFNGIGLKLLHFIDPVNKLNEIDAETYQPNASTPLFDALGFGINKLLQVTRMIEKHNVLVTVLTDGEENASKEYAAKDIKLLIEDLKLKRWTFTYIGTDHDVEKFASSLSINNSMSFDKNEEGIATMFSKEREARSLFSKKISLDEDTNQNFYNKDK
ncbi:vWA domain-containing protein [Pedobacter cryotolerans]|uniref:VWA domain-containing protein n=1 Tax=Pedobacter cryotolerans TaxID=2571270 RepID=A0A4U1CD62_9SPHI|nr:vWA domain-containing protein [Pedobacter cryotolerans]TKC03197.1 VWA domain-containing protein [Pedobacter cryotolerans]